MAVETKRLYEEDAHLFTCEAVVVDAFAHGGGFAAVLDRTVFFPEGGGQPGDRGTLNDTPVTDTILLDERVLHLTDEALQPGTAVTARIDVKRRMDLTQQHSGEHLLSFALHALYGAKNIGFHLTEDHATIDMDMSLTADELDCAEELANRIVLENRPVTIYEIGQDELETLVARKKADIRDGRIRVVDMENADVCTCCGTHVKRTGEIGIIKVIRADRHKSGVRITFACGGRALLDYRRKNRLILEAGALLSTSDDRVPELIRRREAETAALKGALKAANAARAGLEAQQLREAGENRIVRFLEGGADYAKLLLAAVSAGEDAAALLFCESDNGRVLYVAGKSADCPLTLSRVAGAVNDLLSGKGGGSPLFVQGSVSASADRVKQSLDGFKVIMENE